MRKPQYQLQPDQMQTHLSVLPFQLQNRPVPDVQTATRTGLGVKHINRRPGLGF